MENSDENRCSPRKSVQVPNYYGKCSIKQTQLSDKQFCLASKLMLIYVLNHEVELGILKSYFFACRNININNICISETDKFYLKDAESDSTTKVNLIILFCILNSNNGCNLYYQNILA
jgi:hypothetical protein